MYTNDDFLEFDLQLFADLEGVEDDDLTVDKNDTNLGDDEDDEDISLEELLAKISSEEDPEEEEEEEEEPEEEPEEKPEDEDEDVEALINKRVIEEVNRIIPQRLARDRKTQQVQELEQITGMTLEQIRAQVIENAVQETAERMGISEEEAREIVSQKHENAGLKAEKDSKAQEEAEVSAAMQQVKYLQDKTEYSKKPKLARVLTKDILDEIDTFTQKGSLLPFEDGMKYVLGGKLATGELIDKVQAGAANKAKRTVSARPTVPQSKGSGNKSNGVALTKQEKILAANLGVSEKEFAAEKISETNRRRRGR